MDYKCDVCGTGMAKRSGYSFTTNQVASSVGYWKHLFTAQPDLAGDDGSGVAMATMIAIIHATPWIVCEECSGLVEADRDNAREHARLDRAPPGCGPGDQQSACMAAAYAWSLIRDEWPISVQIGDRTITHDPEKGTRCDFCRRVLYGDEEFTVSGEEAYQRLLSEGFRFVRNPVPGHYQGSEPFRVACGQCLERGRPTDASAVAHAATTDTSAMGIRSSHSEGSPAWRWTVRIGIALLIAYVAYAAYAAIAAEGL